MKKYLLTICAIGTIFGAVNDAYGMRTVFLQQLHQQKQFPLDLPATYENTNTKISTTQKSTINKQNISADWFKFNVEYMDVETTKTILARQIMFFINGYGDKDNLINEIQTIKLNNIAELNHLFSDITLYPRNNHVGSISNLFTTLIAKDATDVINAILDIENITPSLTFMKQNISTNSNSLLDLLNSPFGFAKKSKLITLLDNAKKDNVLPILLTQKNQQYHNALYESLLLPQPEFATIIFETILEKLTLCNFRNIYSCVLQEKTRGNNILKSTIIFERLDIFSTIYNVLQVCNRPLLAKLLGIKVHQLGKQTISIDAKATFAQNLNIINLIVKNENLI